MDPLFPFLFFPGFFSPVAQSIAALIYRTGCMGRFSIGWRCSPRPVIGGVRS
ncbi:hypothetical protein BDV23DRAFT_149157, partial [Aspergillus alliaceus]